MTKKAKKKIHRAQYMKRNSKICARNFLYRGIFCIILVGLTFLLFGFAKSAALAAHTSTKNITNLSISNIIVGLEPESQIGTKIYPGYTMSFDVAVVSGFAEGQKPVKFEYSVVDRDDEVIYSIGEQRKISGENVFTKRMTLPSDIKTGTYKLRIESTVGEQKMTQEQFFEIEKSPVVMIKDNSKFLLVSLVSGNGWFLGGAIACLLILTFFFSVVVVHRRNKMRPHSS